MEEEVLLGRADNKRQRAPAFSKTISKKLPNRF